MTKSALIFCLVAASLAAKDRAWQTGKLLDSTFNPYFRAVDSDRGGSKPDTLSQTDTGMVTGVNMHHSEGDVVYENFVVQSVDQVYMVELTRLKAYKSPRLSLTKPLSFAVEKDKMWFLDLDQKEYETKILKKVNRPGYAAAETIPAPAPEAPPAKAEKEVKAKPEKEAKAKPEKEVQAAKAEKPKPAKPDSVFATGVLSNNDLSLDKPKPAPAKTAAAAPAPAEPLKAQPKPNAPAQVASVTPPKQSSQKPELKPEPKPEKKPEPKAEVAVAKPPQKVQSEPARPEAPAARSSLKDRAWQSGQLLSVANNNYFFNVTYSSDTDASSWPFTLGSDGRLTVNGQVGNPTTSLYTYDNYVIESEYVAYLVQRLRPKTSPPARFPGTHPLRFAVEKSKLYVVDDEGKEYETKVVKLIQKDAIVDPTARAAK